MDSRLNRRRWSLATWSLATLLAIVAVVVCSAIATGPLQAFPNSADEATNLWIAERILEGRLSLPAPAIPDAVTALWRTVRDDRWIGLYPPAWPATLAPFVALGAPWLANPVLSGLTLLALVALAGVLYGDASTGLSAAVLLLTSPMFLLNGASFFAHPFALLWTTIAAAAWWRATATRDASSPRRPSLLAAIAGLATGLAASMRPPTAVIAMLPVLMVRAAACREGRDPRRLAMWAIGCVVGVGPLVAHNVWSTGSPWHSAYSLFPSDVGARFDLGFLVGRLELIGVYRAAFRGYAFDPLIAALLLPALLFAPLEGRRRSADLALWLMLPLNAAAILINPQASSPGNQYGPRYAYTLLIPMYLLVARAVVVWLPGRSRRWLTLGLVVALGLWATARRIDDHATQVRYRTTLYRAVDGAALERSVVFLGTGIGLMDRRDLTRNSPGFTDPVVYAIDRGPSGNVETMATMFSARRGLRWRETGAGRGVLEVLEPTLGRPAPDVAVVIDGVVDAIPPPPPALEPPLQLLAHDWLGDDGGDTGTGWALPPAAVRVALVDLPRSYAVELTVRLAATGHGTIQIVVDEAVECEHEVSSGATDLVLSRRVVAAGVHRVTVVRTDGDAAARVELLGLWIEPSPMVASR